MTPVVNWVDKPFLGEVLPLLRREYSGVDVDAVVARLNTTRWKAMKSSLQGFPDATRIWMPCAMELFLALKKEQKKVTAPVRVSRADQPLLNKKMPKPRPSLFCCCGDSAVD
jgi:hypothetical protein